MVGAGGLGSAVGFTKQKGAMSKAGVGVQQGRAGLA